MLGLNLELNTLFLGDRSVVFSNIKRSLIEKYGENNLTLFEIEKLNISIDDVRRAISFAGKSGEGKKIIMLSSFYWGQPAQNSLLKVLEETGSNTVIFLFGLHTKYFLPTILSRIQRFEDKSVNRYAKIAKEVLSLDQNERLENKQVKKILSLKITDTNFETNTENEKKDREAHILFLQALMEEIMENKQNLKLDKGFSEKIFEISTMSDTEGGSPHLFIDWLLLSTPKIVN